jgi:hypothetical protein
MSILLEKRCKINRHELQRIRNKWQRINKKIHELQRMSNAPNQSPVQEQSSVRDPEP